MNSEELELSLKAEFESYLNELFAGMRENAADLQKNFEAEFEKHRSQLDEVTRRFAERFDSSPKLDIAFSQSVTEHLRLAKDSGAELAAMAFSEAEKLNTETAATTSYGAIRDAIDDISSKTSQSTILTALVEHAAKFAPRGVFFIVKNENFVGWKRFGQDRPSPEEVANLKFEAVEGTVLAHAVNELKTADGAWSESSPDRVFIDPLELGRPDRMYAVPLVARGRGVAVMYVDYGVNGTNLNVEALETLVRVAGLTVELLAASQTASVQPQPAAAVPVYSGAVETVEAEPTVPVTEYDHSAEAVQPDQPASDFFVSKTFNTSEFQSENQASAAYEIESSSANDFDSTLAAEKISEGTPEFEYEATSAASAEIVEEEGQGVEVETFDATGGEKDTTEEVHFEPELAAEEVPVPASEFADIEPVSHISSPEPDVVTNGYHAETPTPVVEVAPSHPQVRFSDRNMDLPIEVADDERRLHNDARRFARLLVSEIKLYNEQKVSEGRESGDLYDRLREAIDRSRDMYEKRVQPAVAAKFDYFHYELVNNLAEGEEQRLGHSYVIATPV